LQRGGDINALGINFQDPSRSRALAAASRDGGVVITTALDATVRVWSTAGCLPQASAASSPRLRGGLTSTTLLEFQSNTWSSSTVRGFGEAAAFSPDRSKVLLCRGDDYGRLTDQASGQPVGPPLRGDLSFPTFAPVGSRIATAAYSYRTAQVPRVRLWDGDSGKPVVGPLLSPKYVYGQPLFSPDGRTLAVPCVGMTLLLDSRGRLRHHLVEPNVHYCAVFSPDSRRLAVGTSAWDHPQGPGIRLWDTTTGQPLGPFCSSPPDSYHRLHFRDAGRTLLVVALATTGALTHYRARLGWHDGTTGKSLRTPVSLGEVGPTAFSADGDRLAVSYVTREVQQWNCETGRRVGSTMTQPDTMRALCYSPDRRFLAIATHDQAIRLWDAATCEPVGPPLLHRAPVLALAFTPDGTRLVSVTSTGFPHTWPVPRPVADDLERAEQWLAVASGQVPAGDRQALLDARAWNERRAAFERRWPEADPALYRPPTQDERDEALARDAEETGDGRAEAACLERLLARRPGDWFLQARLAANRSRAGDLAGAAAAGTAAEKAAGAAHRVDLANWYRHRAVVSGLLGAWPLALWYQDRAEALGPAEGDFYLERARTHVRLGNAAGAQADLEKAAARAPDAAGVLAVIEEGAALGAWPAVARLHERLPLSAPGAYRHALACLKAGQPAAYRKVVARLLARLPRDPHPIEANLAAMACALGPDAVRDWKRPLALIEQALRRRPVQGKNDGGIRGAFLNTLGAVLYRAGRWQDAIDRLREALALAGKEGTFQDWVFLAMAHHRLGQHADARAMLERARSARADERPLDVWEIAERDLLLAEALALVAPAKGP
jgi:WD40 repeat protein/tetratricopeptide (TPR) repeat protein